LSALRRLARDGRRVIIPMHPRTLAAVRRFRLSTSGLIVLPPASYVDMLCLEANAWAVVTDSGGAQKEAYWLRVPCLTLRNETEWPETLATGWNTLVGTDPKRIVRSGRRITRPRRHPALYGSGRAAQKLVADLVRWGGKDR
jgi:UDP-N-acetylglucosamine 2-epimerase